MAEQVQMLVAEQLVDENRPPIIVFLGTTGSGKTSVAIEMPEGEAVCADRFTAFGEMDIGTATPTVTEQACMRHHLIDVFDLREFIGQEPREGFVPLQGESASSVLLRLARGAIDGIAAQNNIPIIVGGSAPTIRNICLGSTHEENPALRTWLHEANEEDLREHCRRWGLPFFEYDPSLEAVRQKIYREHTTVRGQPLPNVYPISIEHDIGYLIRRIQDRLDQMWDEGLPEEVERLTDEYGWVQPLREAIGYKEFMPDPEGNLPQPDKVRRAILANTIGFVWSQGQEFNQMIPMHHAKGTEQAIEIGRWVIEQYRTSGLLASRRFYYPWTVDGRPRV